MVCASTQVDPDHRSRRIPSTLQLLGHLEPRPAKRADLLEHPAYVTRDLRKQNRYALKDELEKRLTEMPCVKPAHADEEIKIAMVTFAFDNAKIIRGLRERGQAIQVEDWAKLEKINDRLTRGIGPR